MPESSQEDPRRLTRYVSPVLDNPRRTWVVGFLAFFALAAAWALATPLTAAPDEPSHMVKAAATARGELGGIADAEVISINGVVTNMALTKVEVPAQYAHLDQMYRCYYNQKDVPASCATPMTGGSVTALVKTSAGGNNPVYPLAVGWTTLISSGEAGLYLMRLVSAAICSAFLASAVVTAARWSRNRGWVLLGVFVTATPTALFLNGTVNPNAIEVSGAVLLWTAMLALFTDPQPDLTSRRLTRAGLASVALANVRPLGPLWIIGILACALLAGEKGTFRTLLRRQSVWIWTGVVTAGVLAAFAWSIHSNALTISSVDRPDLTFAKAAAYTFHHTWYYIDSMIAVFGWLDVRAPREVHIAWYIVLAALAALALRFSRWRERLALFGVAAAIVLIPMVAQGKQAARLGYIWQGRYLLAVAVGLPLLATVLIAKRSTPRFREISRAPLAGLLGVTLLGGFAAFYNTLHRYAVGVDGPWFSLHHAWTPPGGFATVLGLYLVGAALVTAMILGAGGNRLPGLPSDPDSADGVFTGAAAREAAHPELPIPSQAVRSALPDGVFTQVPKAMK